MLQNTDPTSTEPTNSAELSPVKRALLEIRQLRAQLNESHRASHEPIAIVGIALRLPGGITTPDRFWQALVTGEDLISPVPLNRWEAGEYLNADPDHAGTMYDAHGGFLTDIDQFDAEFFGVNAREAASMDPQHRLLLELSWEALERAGIDPKSLANTASGVYLGMSSSDYGRQTMRDARDIHAYSAVGSALSIAAGRISYFLGLRGPSMVLDTACSSSLVAAHLACESLRRKEINLAIVGGSNLILSPDFNVSFARTRMLARDGRSKTFDVAADGYVRGEGCCVIVLKRYSDALRDGDPILASIAGSAVNQDGRSAGITAPNGPSQEAVIRAALDNAGVAADAVTYVETHGTGTPLGDPIEVQALGAVYGASRDAGTPLHIGSVKTNLGHTEAVAGLVGLIKVVLMMQPERGIPPHLHFKNPNPNIDFDRLRIDVPTEFSAWSRDLHPIHAGVSSFGFSGTNAHLILASTPLILAEKIVAKPVQETASLLLLSAASDVALHALAEKYVLFLRETNESFADICFTAATLRANLPHRLALMEKTCKAAADVLARWLSGEEVDELKTASPESRESEVKAYLSQQGPLLQIRDEYLTGGNVREHFAASLTNHRRVDLPVYSFQRSRYWFGPDPQTLRAQEREKTWRDAVGGAEKQSQQGPLGWKLDRFERKWAVLHELTLAHARNAFVHAGVFNDQEALRSQDVLVRAGFQSIYLNLVTRWLNGLADAGVLFVDAGNFKAVTPLESVSLEPHWHQAEILLDDDPGTLAYLRQCGSLLTEVMAGRISALETLFPEGSFALTEGLYESGIVARYFNSIAASGIAEAARNIGQRRNARILEIGGGTGGTTSSVLPLLPQGQVEYWFTDLSELFLARARKKFSAYPFVHYAIFDLDRALAEQGIGSSHFDIILAANVIHASRNLTAALTQVRSLLAPGGLLVMLESTVHHSWFDMTTGLIEGWQHFEDDIRQGQPLLDPEQWKSILKLTGFTEVAVYPEDNSATSVLGQHVLLVRAATVADENSLGSLTPQKLNEWKPQSEVQSVTDAETGLAENFQLLSTAEKEAAMLEFVRVTIQRVFQLGISSEELGPRDRLSDLGMDSLIALELRGELAKGLGPNAHISSTIAFDTGTVGELANALLRAVEPQSLEVIPASEIDKSRITSSPITAEQLDEMSEEEVEKLLSERLSRR
jgi:3-oxoacyl-[acyl-carrier-protein] synthase II